MPMLERIAGNRELKQDLKTALGSGRIAHSILLVGEPGCGAGFAARCLAADYLYPNGGPHAEAVLRGQDTESIVVRGEGASGQIKVEAIRDARQNIQKSALSSDAKGRVLFIYGAQNLNGASANAMLKIMEEPPEGVMFLLTASSAAAVLPPIRSRCVSRGAAYTMAPVPTEECAAALRTAQPELNEQNAQDLAFLYEGHIGLCLKALTDPAAKVRGLGSVGFVELRTYNDAGKLTTPRAERLKDRRGLFVRQLLEAGITTADGLETFTSPDFEYLGQDPYPGRYAFLC